ncbi:septal ring lytic transglycosylase RlpA family protein [Novosphingobium album (ex Hu et al. 2023)]|uniref:SPOR domain-containing protein n=1 Tax=Novosphingobium album (ex Hu et al. 2023) TaxID=2930093 RepID=A0ABT0AXB5_9SPHN|nr:SPOR domain-containing protein [Novosphingobium album (ex Hu et al. 2023)]MCJ2177476.1 SPOR domain-containing protein [Novosphingobium album (ex Hu et al. 2023)]
MRLPVNRVLPLAVLILLGTGAASARDHKDKQPAPVTGPAADYPVVIGQPFTIGQTVWTPTDQLNYDAVGDASVGDISLAGVTGAHKTLPLPCYVEVTSLASGKTILVRLERRGPMVNDVLVELSPMAAQQLGIVPGSHAPVRVRRVNPPEQERAMLRMGERAPERMATPDGLLKVLRRKLADQSPLLPPPSTPPSMPAMTDKPAPVPTPKAAAQKPAPAKLSTPAKAAKPVPAAMPKPEAAKPPVASAAPPAPKGSLLVRAGAFSVEANARKAAKQLGGNVTRTGKFWIVSTGPFANRAQAAPALEKVRNAGYKDARIQSAD